MTRDRYTACMTDRQQLLEEKLAATERHVEQLDELVRELFDKFANLEKSLTRFREETDQRFATRDDSKPEDHVPPHWGQKS